MIGLCLVSSVKNFILLTLEQANLSTRRAQRPERRGGSPYHNVDVGVTIPHILLLVLDGYVDAYIMFTHFGKATDEGCISDQFAFMALTRNMAIACRERMKFVDLCIPIHFGKKNKLSRNTTSAILEGFFKGWS